MQMEIKEEAVKQIASNIPENELEVIIISSGELENGSSRLFWEEEGKEFKYLYKIYDVVKIKQTKGKVYLYCLNDVKEESIIKKFGNYVYKNTNQNNFNNLFSKIPGYLFHEIKYDLPVLTADLFQNFNILTYISISLENSTPPPSIS